MFNLPEECVIHIISYLPRVITNKYNDYVKVKLPREKHYQIYYYKK